MTNLNISLIKKTHYKYKPTRWRHWMLCSRPDRRSHYTPRWRGHSFRWRHHKRPQLLLFNNEDKTDNKVTTLRD